MSLRPVLPLLRRPLAVVLTLVAGAGLTLAATTPPATAEHVVVHPKVKAVRYVEVDRTTATLTMTAQAVNTRRQHLNFQQWLLDTTGGDQPELLVSWFVGDETAYLDLFHGGHLRQGCRRVPVSTLPRETGAEVRLPGRCLITGPQTVRRVAVQHITVMTVRRPGADICKSYPVPRRGYLGPLGAGAGPDRGYYGVGRPPAGASAKGC